MSPTLKYLLDLLDEPEIVFEPSFHDMPPIELTDTG